jgi:hypothetical protein
VKSRSPKQIWLKLFLLALLASPAFAEVSLVIEEAVGPIGELAGTGHAALYFSHLCAASPIELRPCDTGEAGAVVSTYQDLGDSDGYKWLAISLPAFLYGTDSPDARPLYTNSRIERALQARYHAHHLAPVIPHRADGSLPSGRWRELVASGLRRDAYFLTVATTPEQDQQFLQVLTQQPHQNQFNVFTNNCSDFVSDTLNAVFPSATRRDLLNDFGVSTPKAIARTFLQYASRHPELNLRITRHTQSDQTVRRSTSSRNITEEGFKSKKYIALAAVTQPITLAALSGIYYAKGRFSLDHEYKASLSPDTNQLWSTFKRQVDQHITRALELGLFTGRKQVQRYHASLESSSQPTFDAHGHLALAIHDSTGTHITGLTPANITSPESDPVTAYKLLLSKLAYMTAAAPTNRPTTAEFQLTLDLLQSISVPTPNAQRQD